MRNRRQRGQTTNSTFIASTKDDERHIEFDDDGSPSGPNCTVFGNYIAYITRDRVPINYKNWKSVPEEIKTRIWMQVKDFWHIQDDSRKKTIIRLMGIRWKQHKSRLVRDYIVHPKPAVGDPCETYNIQRDVWEEFCQYVASKEFQQKSQQGREAAKKNIHPHRLGSSGYAGAKKRWKESDVISSCSSSSSPISSVSDPRSYKWLRARAKPAIEGVAIIENPATLEVLRRVQEKIGETSQGTFTSERQHDILSASIGTPEHPGRIRGHSEFASLKTVFGKSTKKRTIHSDCISKAQANKMQEQLQAGFQEGLNRQREELTAEFNKKMQALFDSMSFVQPPNFGIPAQQSQPQTQVSSYSVEIETTPSMQGPVSCKLYAPAADTSIEVAEGRMHFSGPGVMCHNEPIPVDHCKVQIDCCLEDYRMLRLPKPVADLEFLADAVGSFVLWPTNMIQVLGQDTTPQKQVKEKRQATVPSSSSTFHRELLLDDATLMTLDPSCTHLYKVLMSQPPNTDNFEIFFGKEVFGFEGKIIIYMSAIIDMLKYNWLDVSILQIFCIVSANRCKTFGLTRFCFLDPYRCAETSIKIEYEMTVDYLTQYFEANVQMDSFIFLPYIEGRHWILLVAYLAESRCYVIDPINPNVTPKLSIQAPLNTAFRSYWMQKGVAKKNGGKFSFVRIKGPHQPGGSECGYYVMRILYDIINTCHNAITFPEIIEPSVYTQSELNEVRGMIAEYLPYEL